VWQVLLVRRGAQATDATNPQRTNPQRTNPEKTKKTLKKQIKNGMFCIYMYDMF
jgi:hypothetical protein